IPASDRAMRAGEWPVFAGEDCHGKTLGILGFGRIGSGVAKVAGGLGMSLIGWGPTVTPGRAASVGGTLLELDAVLRPAGGRRIPLRLSPGTRGWPSGAGRALARPTFCMNNPARGATGAGAARGEWRKGGRVAGAAWDVFVAEPLPPGHPLTRLDNVVLT